MLKQFLLFLFIIGGLFLTSCNGQISDVEEVDLSEVEAVFEKNFRYGELPTSNYIDAYDAQIYSGAPSTNYNSNIYISLGRSTVYVYRALFVFYINNYFATPVKIKKAYLTLDQGSGSYAGSGFTVDIHKMTDSWTEGLATWNYITTDKYESTPSGSCNITYTDHGTFSVELPAGLVQQWLDDPVNNNGVLLKSSDETIANRYVEFYERGVSITSRKPLLTIYYTLP